MSLIQSADNMNIVNGDARFRDAAGNYTYVKREDLTVENMEILSNPSALATFNQSLEDFYDGRFDDFDDFDDFDL